MYRSELPNLFNLGTFIKDVAIISDTLIAGNTEAILTCEVTLSPENGTDPSLLSVEWCHNGINVKSQYNISEQTIISELKIANVITSHAGTYTCSALIDGIISKTSTEDVCVNCKFHAKFIDNMINM